MTPDEVSSAVVAAGRNEGPRIVYTAWVSGRLTVDHLRAVICDAWGLAEFPAQYLRPRQWLDMFAATGFVSAAAAPAPTQPMVLWRGSPLWRRRGFSWTTDWEQAVWFARRLSAMGDLGRVWETVVPPAAVLAFVDGRDEHEVIVDPRCLRGSGRPTSVWPTTEGRS